MDSLGPLRATRVPNLENSPHVKVFWARLPMFSLFPWLFPFEMEVDQRSVRPPNDHG